MCLSDVEPDPGLEGGATAARGSRVGVAQRAEGSRPDPAAVDRSRARPAGRWRRALPMLLVGIAACVTYAICYLGRGLDVPDEGLLLHAAERLASGEAPYRDVYFIYTPG